MFVTIYRRMWPGKLSQVRQQIVAGLQKMRDLRRFFIPVADLRRSSAKKRRPATFRDQTCDG